MLGCCLLKAMKAKWREPMRFAKDEKCQTVVVTTNVTDLYQACKMLR